MSQKPIKQGRKFGERQNRTDNRYGNEGTNRFGRSNNDYDYSNDYDTESSSRPKSRYILCSMQLLFNAFCFFDVFDVDESILFYYYYSYYHSFRSRFVRSHQQDDASDNEQSRVRFYEKDKEKERERVLDTEDVSRGTLSGIIRLADSPVHIHRSTNAYRIIMKLISSK